MDRQQAVETLRWYVIFYVGLNVWGNAAGLPRMVAGLLLLASVWGRRPPEVVRIGGELAGGTSPAGCATVSCRRCCARCWTGEPLFFRRGEPLCRRGL
jgi:hypothetical protein